VVVYVFLLEKTAIISLQRVFSTFERADVADGILLVVSISLPLSQSL
jgi:hypothetical protein